MGTDGGPVIASSDRFAAVLPYCKVLHEEDHHRWGGIMPWKFPQQASKGEEEAFLLKEFPERECHLQGFRFLKQVWLSIALNNFENRMPLIVDGWFQHKGQEYLHDPDFQIYLLNEDACAQTFFEQADIDLYGSTFLDTAVKCIQHRIRNPQQFAASSPSAPVTASTTRQSELADDSNVAPIVSPVTTDLPLLQPAKNTKVATSVTTTVLKPTATVFSSSSTPVQAAATVLEPSFARRNFSDEADMPQQRHQFSRKRASTGKRSSFSDRTGHLPAQALSDARQPFVKVPQGHPPHQSPGLPASMGPVPQFATRGPNAFHLPSPSPHYPVPFSPGQLQPPGVFGAKPPPGFEDSHMRNFPFHGPAGFVPGPPPAQTFGNPLLSERNMNHGDTGHFVRQSDRTVYGQGPEQSRKRRDSNASYGTRAGGSVRGRGRGGRGRNSVSRFSIDEQYQPGYRYPSNGYNDRPGFAANQLNAGQRALDDRGSWRSQKHDENLAPIRHHFDPFPHGPPQILHNPRHASQPHGQPPGTQQAVNTALPVINVDRRLVSDHKLPEKLPSDASDHCVMPLEKYGCSRTVIGEKCLYANKVIAFAIPADVPEHTIRQCFEQFGPVTHIAEARNVLLDGRPGDPHRFITFVAAPPARACVKQRRVVIHGKQIDVEVAREFWDSSHAKFEPRTATGIPFKDMQNSAPPSMHYIQNSAIGAMPQAVVNLARNNEHLPRDVYAVAPVTAMDSISVDTTPTASGSGTPKAKGKKSGKKNRKTLREHSVDRALRNTASQTPITDDASSVTTASTKHTTPAKRYDSVRADHAEPVPVSCLAAPANEDHATPPQVPVPGPSPSKAAAPPPDLAQDQPQRGPEALSKPVEAESKSEEDAVDDSFHTASATPSDERTTIDDTITTPKARSDKSSMSIEHVQVQTSPSKVVVAAAAVDPQSAINEEPVQKDDKKFLLPALPRAKSKVSIALPEIDTSWLPVSATENSSEANGTDGQRTVSGSSGIATAFVTAPNTPGSPMFGQKSMPAVQSKKEAKSSEDNKAKGPAQTESFSLFGKAKKTKKAKASKGNSRTTSRAGPELPKPDHPPMRQSTNTTKPTPLAEQTDPVEKSEEASNAEADDTVAHDADTTASIAAPADTIQDVTKEEIPSTASFNVVANSSSDACDKPVSPVRGSILRRLTGMFSGSSDLPMVAETGAVSGLGIQTEPANENSADKPVVNEHALSDNPEGIAAEASSSKKNKKKKKPKKKPATGDLSDEPIANAEQPKVMVLEMSHLAPSNEVSTPLYVLHGTDADGTGASHSGAATPNKDSGDSSPAKVKPSRRLISDSHLVQAPPIRRAHPRVKHKKSSDSSDSREESILSTGRDQQQSVSTPDEASTYNVCTIITLPVGHYLRGTEVVESNDVQDQLQKLYVVYTAIDPVEQARRRLEKFAEQEKEIKQQRQEIGKILEVFVEDDTEEEVTKVVDSVE